MRFNEFNPTTIINELKMSPGSLQQWASSKEADGVLMGIEFELAVPDIGDPDDETEVVPDYSENRRVNGLKDLFDFFTNEVDGIYLDPYEKNLIEEEFFTWQDDTKSKWLRSDDVTDRISSEIIDLLDIEDFIDDAKEELSNKKRLNITDELVEKTAKTLMRNYAYECIDTQNRLYQEVFNSIEDELNDDFFDSYDDRQWLMDIDVNDMEDASNRWRLTWPYFTYQSASDDIETVVDNFSKDINVPVVYAKEYHGAERDSNKWIIEPDPSIETNKPGDGGLEFISPPEPVHDSLAHMRQVWTWAKKQKCYTNDSTGLHINVSVPNYSRDNLDFVKLAIFIGDDYILNQFDRAASTYAKSAMEIIRRQIDYSRPESIKDILTNLRSQLISSASKLIHSGYTEKHTSINPKNGWVEFRGPGGDYLSRSPDEIASTALRLAMGLKIACDPNAYRQEYIKKLYKLLTPAGDVDSINLFSAYVSGTLNKSLLIQYVRNLQQKRSK